MSGTAASVRSASSAAVSPLARIARQGIYDPDGALVAHELLFRGGAGNVADLSLAAPANPLGGVTNAGDYATSQVIAATFGDFGLRQLADDRPLFLNLTRAFLVGELPLPFGPQGVVLEVLEDVLVDDEVLAGIAGLRRRGFRLALDDYVGEEHRAALLSQVDVVKIEVPTVAGRLADVVAACRELAPQAQLLAERVETADEVDECRGLGFSLFQGYHFHRPAVLQAARLSPSQVACLQLLRVLNDTESSMADIERAVAADPGLSLRVLRTASSAGASTIAQRAIGSLRQAVVLLGPTSLSAWVMLTLLGGTSDGRTIDLVPVIARAQCCQLIAERYRLAIPGYAYTAGLLSGVASVLGIDVRQVAEGAGVSLDMVESLATGNGPLGAVVDAVAGHEHGDPLAGPRYGVSSFALSRAYLEAWAAATALVQEALVR